MYSDLEADEFISEVIAETRWKEKTMAVPEFLQGFKSAQPVRLRAGERELDLGDADLMHPFLAFSRRRRTKLYAENLVWDETDKRYTPQGPPLEIPKDYLGWFELVQQGAPLHQARHTTIGAVIHTKCKQFLVRTTLIGYLAAGNNNGDGDLQLGKEIRIYPGEIVKVKNVIVKKWKSLSVDSSEVSNKKSKAPASIESKFAECIDAKDRQVYLPFAHPGQFYGLFSSDMKTSKSPRLDLAYYIYDMINFGFPFLVKVVFGWPPADYPEFSGFMRILGVNRPDSVILRSLKPGSCVVLELPMDTDVQIEKMANPEFINGNKTFEKVLAHSCDRIYPYLIGMKHMDTRYPVVASATNTKDKAGSGGDDASKRDMCRMARPRNMNSFDPMEIFPPLDEPIKRVSESWTLSFKDPEHIAEPLQHMKDSESVLMTPETAEDGTSDTHAPSRQVSLAGKMQGLGVGSSRPLSGHKRHEDFWHKRAAMERGFVDREADC